MIKGCHSLFGVFQQKTMSILNVVGMGAQLSLFLFSAYNLNFLKIIVPGIVKSVRNNTL